MLFKIEWCPELFEGSMVLVVADNEEQALAYIHARIADEKLNPSGSIDHLDYSMQPELIYKPSRDGVFNIEVLGDLKTTGIIYADIEFYE